MLVVRRRILGVAKRVRRDISSVRPAMSGREPCLPDD